MRVLTFHEETTGIVQLSHHQNDANEVLKWLKTGG